jgi:hypothetical protein
MYQRQLPLLGVCLVMLATVIAGAGCSASPTSPTPPPTIVTSPPVALSPARSIAGTWTTLVPVTFTQQTDFCGNGMQDTGKSEWNVTWIVTAVTGFTNVVDVEMRYTRGAATRTGCGGDSGYVSLVSPNFMRLCISSSELSRCTGENYPNGQAFGPFTSDIISVTWTHRECLIYCFGEVTETNALKMTKRS